MSDGPDLRSADEREPAEVIRMIREARPGSPPPPADQPRTSAPRMAATTESVLARWRADGALVHEPTGIAMLDAATGGGPVYGSRWYLLGAPDAGKTALVVQIADEYASRGVVVGLLAVDEEPEDIVTRLVQRRGYHRAQTERREHDDLDRMGRSLGSLETLHMYGPGWTIEDAARDLAAVAQGRRMMLGIDSIQTVACAAEELARRDGRELSVTQSIEARVRAVRAVATQHRLIAIATSEMGRAAYRSTSASDQIDPLAAAKWSGAVEYSARVMVALRSVADEPDIVQLTLPKNKHWPAGHPRDPIYLRIDRATQRLEQDDAYEPDSGDAREEREAAQSAAMRTRAVADAGVVAAILARQPGLGSRDLRGAMNARGIGVRRSDAGLAALGPALVRIEGPRRVVRHYVHGGQLPEGVLAEVPSEVRTRVIMARPPSPIADSSPHGSGE